MGYRMVGESALRNADVHPGGPFLKLVFFNFLFFGSGMQWLDVGS